MKPFEICLLVLALLYMSIKISTIVLIYKIIHIGPFSASASTLIIPLWFFLGDIIAEVYGYKIAKQIIWIALICQFVFACICWVMINIQAPPNWPIQEAYNQILGKLPRVSIASFTAIFVGAYLNAFILTKWKVLLHGKYFWLRSLGSTTIGEAIFTFIAYTMEFYGIMPFSKLLELMTISYVIKLIANPILVLPVCITAAFIESFNKKNPEKEPRINIQRPTLSVKEVFDANHKINH